MPEPTLLTTLGDAWCNVMHASPTWPIHGHYHCGVCGREYPVLWEQSTSAHLDGARIREWRS